MKFPCTLRRQGGDWLLRHAGTGVGTVEVRAASREQAVEKMQRELRYRLEICPCTGELYQDMAIEIQIPDGA